MAYNYWYAYICSDSSETRGRRPSHEGGCGHWNVRSTREPIYDDSTVQGSPCKNCGRRQRLNPGMLWEQKMPWQHGLVRPDGTVIDTFNRDTRKAWAERHVNRRNREINLNACRETWEALPENERPPFSRFWAEWQSCSNASEQRGEEE
jgi:hypothetical protein